MLRATAVTRKLAVKADRIVDTVELDHEARYRRRATLAGAKGTEVLLDLDKATALKDGDALKLEDGSLLQVKAAPEKLMEIRSENPLRLLKAAWHVGNRHTPVELTGDALYLGEDHVLEEMLRGLGVTIAHVERPFEPERGAYEGGHGHHHGHDHHGHDHHSHDHHDHGHDHGHHHHDQDHHHHEEKRDVLAVGSTASPADHHHGHDHGADCGCGHDHHHDHGHGHHKHG